MLEKAEEDATAKVAVKFASEKKVSIKESGDLKQ
jgi:hypothetical protein